MKRLPLLALIASLLAGCTLIYIEGNANRVVDSGNHSSTLSVPDAKTTRGSATHNLRYN